MAATPVHDGIVVYCLASPDAQRSYVGVTDNLARRLRQHRGEIAGGAKPTTKVPTDWALACHVTGCGTRKFALQMEWAWHRAGQVHTWRARKQPATAVPLKRRLKHLARTLALDRVAKTAPPTADANLVVHWPAGSAALALSATSPLLDAWPDSVRHVTTVLPPA